MNMPWIRYLAANSSSLPSKTPFVIIHDPYFSSGVTTLKVTTSDPLHWLKFTIMIGQVTTALFMKGPIFGKSKSIPFFLKLKKERKTFKKSLICEKDTNYINIFLLGFKFEKFHQVSSVQPNRLAAGLSPKCL